MKALAAFAGGVMDAFVMLFASLCYAVAIARGLEFVMPPEHAEFRLGLAAFTGLLLYPVTREVLEVLRRGNAMVGGTVVGIARKRQYTLLHVEDGADSCSVRVVEKRLDNGGAVQINLGDGVWWQSGKIMWTPAESKRAAGGLDCDIRLPKLGHSH